MVCSLPLKNQLLHRAGIQARVLFIFMFCSHRWLFKRALNQDRAIKRVYTVIVNQSIKHTTAPEKTVYEGTNP